MLTQLIVASLAIPKVYQHYFLQKCGNALAITGCGFINIVYDASIQEVIVYPVDSAQLSTAL